MSNRMLRSRDRTPVISKILFRIVTSLISVSYTHLIRALQLRHAGQLGNRARRLGIRAQYRRDRAVAQRVARCVAQAVGRAVSYTHLDVYKRQGEYAYLVVDVTPKQELLLIGPGYGLEDPMRLMTGDSANSLTIREYAGQNGLQMAYVTVSSALDALGEEFIRSIDCHWEEDGTLVLMLTCTVPEQEGSAFASTLQCSVTPLIPDAGGEDAIYYGYYEENADEPTYASTGYAMDGENRQETELAFALDTANRHNRCV